MSRSIARTFALTFFTGALLAGAGLGCGAHRPPKALVDARTAYSRAAEGAAKDYTPAELESARQALSLAEQAYNSDGDSPRAHDLAYIAERRAQTADARGRRAAADRSRVEAETAFRTEAAGKIEEQRERDQAQTQQLAAEREARARAEQRSREAFNRLAQAMQVKEEQRGTVITLSGSVLFASNKHDLLPSALQRLNQVADALKESPERTMTVVGYTDSVGRDETNLRLSQQRADAVREYLVSRGLPPDHVTAIGKGKADPIADNKTAEGRANNRRVEIIIAPAQGQQGQQGQVPGKSNDTRAP